MTPEEKQKLFLDLLFTDKEDGGAGGNPSEAKKLAGYHPTYSVNVLLGTKAIQEGIEKRMKQFFAQTAAESGFAMLDVLRNPSNIGNKEKLAAAKELLDRGGFIKTEKLEVSGGGGLFILPAKEQEEDEDGST